MAKTLSELARQASDNATAAYDLGRVAGLTKGAERLEMLGSMESPESFKELRRLCRFEARAIHRVIQAIRIRGD